MPRQNKSVENLLLQGKIRKRGISSSPSSSTSSVLREGYRFKRAIVVGKRGGSTTPVPTWRLIGRSPTPASALRPAASPRYAPSQSGSKSGAAAAAAPPVSARKLAATLWEMNEIPSPRVAKESEENRMAEARRKTRKERGVPPPPPPRSVHSPYLPPHLSDPSHSPISERMERSGTGSRQRRASSILQKLRLADHNVGPMDSISNGSFMDIETRSRVETPAGSNVGVKTRLKDASNALTTSKELLKIINRMWGQEERPSSSMSLISALHAELERARLQVNQFIQEQRSDHSDINYLMKRFAEEKAAWKNKEQEIVEAAVESVAGELEVERKLRKRLESLNKKLGKELAETKSALMKAVKEIENEKRVRLMVEKVCDELARDISEDKAEVEELKRESLKAREEVEKEREMLQLADALREERVQMKLSEAKHQLEEKNAAVDKLRTQLQAYLGAKRSKEKSRGPQGHVNAEEIAEFLMNNNIHFSSFNEEDGEVVEEDGDESEQDSGESDLHSIELNMDNNNNSNRSSYKWPTTTMFEEETKGRRSTSSIIASRMKSSSLQRSISDGIDWVGQSEKLQKASDGSEHKGGGYPDKGCNKDHVLMGSRPSKARGYGGERPPPAGPGPVSKSRLSETKGESHNGRKPRW
ncbi:PREDICTED: uncharacterized protein At5g41620 [Tarenaya hassleriana]|uniref:uncharacterized protein At5g41620 n=1 Tax=Tarenaya hassleriana TaxID=28532 RepID=UPI00053C0A49|nr:PREDICTED: uncharacterized protein At5g41620 [Tarenaya hassleriana]XP_010543816.1 PREDICTED: uncharacterized protein At5g41620 [Tarenaya hassleriana]